MNILMRRMAKFCANISFMFTEMPFLDRYALAKAAGFKAVESGFPFGLTKEQVVQAKNDAGIEQVLINIYTGDTEKGELGFACRPEKQKQFLEGLLTTVEYAKALGVKKIHIMTGIVANPTVETDNCVLSNLRCAVLILEKENIMGLIEPINLSSVPFYYMHSYTKAMQFITELSSPNLKIMADIFHMQHICGNITNNLSDLKDHIGHVQIAQSPNRHEPDSAGELNYKYVLNTLADIGYEDWIGLEYKPTDETTAGLKWINDFGYNL